MAGPVNLNGSVQQATPIAVQLSDGTWTYITGGLTNNTATIASGTALASAAVDCLLGSPLVIYMPSAWDAASMTFSVSYDGINFFDLHKADGTEYAVTVAAAQAFVLSPSDFAGIRYIKPRSGTSGAPVNQTASRLLIIASKLV